MVDPCCTYDWPTLGPHLAHGRPWPMRDCYMFASLQVNRAAPVINADTQRASHDLPVRPMESRPPALRARSTPPVLGRGAGQPVSQGGHIPARARAPLPTQQPPLRGSPLAPGRSLAALLSRAMRASPAFRHLGGIHALVVFLGGAQVQLAASPTCGAGARVPRREGARATRGGSGACCAPGARHRGAACIRCAGRPAQVSGARLGRRWQTRAGATTDACLAPTSRDSAAVAAGTPVLPLGFTGQHVLHPVHSTPSPFGLHASTRMRF